MGWKLVDVLQSCPTTSPSGILTHSHPYIPGICAVGVSLSSHIAPVLAARMLVEMLSKAFLKSQCIPSLAYHPCMQLEVGLVLIHGCPHLLLILRLEVTFSTWDKATVAGVGSLVLQPQMETLCPAQGWSRKGMVMCVFGGTQILATAKGGDVPTPAGSAVLPTTV